MLFPKNWGFVEIKLKELEQQKKKLIVLDEIKKGVISKKELCLMYIRTKNYKPLKHNNK